jgi:hypothetical protein
MWELILLSPAFIILMIIVHCYRMNRIATRQIQDNIRQVQDRRRQQEQHEQDLMERSRQLLRQVPTAETTTSSTGSTIASTSTPASTMLPTTTTLQTPMHYRSYIGHVLQLQEITCSGCCSTCSCTGSDPSESTTHSLATHDVETGSSSTGTNILRKDEENEGGGSCVQVPEQPQPQQQEHHQQQQHQQHRKVLIVDFGDSDIVPLSESSCPICLHDYVHGDIVQRSAYHRTTGKNNNTNNYNNDDYDDNDDDKGGMTKAATATPTKTSRSYSGCKKCIIATSSDTMVEFSYSCEHIFHASCITTWIVLQQDDHKNTYQQQQQQKQHNHHHSQCPMCRRTFVIGSLRREREKEGICDDDGNRQFM